MTWRNSSVLEEIAVPYPLRWEHFYEHVAGAYYQKTNRMNTDMFQVCLVWNLLALQMFAKRIFPFFRIHFSKFFSDSQYLKPFSLQNFELIDAASIHSKHELAFVFIPNRSHLCTFFHQSLHQFIFYEIFNIKNIYVVIFINDIAFAYPAHQNNGN